MQAPFAIACFQCRNQFLFPAGVTQAACPTCLTPNSMPLLTGVPIQAQPHFDAYSVPPPFSPASEQSYAQSSPSYVQQPSCSASPPSPSYFSPSAPSNITHSASVPSYPSPVEMSSRQGKFFCPNKSNPYHECSAICASGGPNMAIDVSSAPGRLADMPGPAPPEDDVCDCESEGCCFRKCFSHVKCEDKQRTSAEECVYCLCFPIVVICDLFCAFISPIVFLAILLLQIAWWLITCCGTAERVRPWADACIITGSLLEFADPILVGLCLVGC